MTPHWMIDSCGQDNAGIKVTTYHDTEGGGGRIERRHPDGRVEERWILPNGKDVWSEAEYILQLQRVRP